MVKFRLPKKFIGKCDWFDEDEDQEKEKEPAGWGGDGYWVERANKWKNSISSRCAQTRECVLEKKKKKKKNKERKKETKWNVIESK